MGNTTFTPHNNDNDNENNDDKSNENYVNGDYMWCKYWCIMRIW